MPWWDRAERKINLSKPGVWWREGDENVTTGKSNHPTYTTPQNRIDAPNRRKGEDRAKASYNPEEETSQVISTKLPPPKKSSISPGNFTPAGNMTSTDSSGEDGGTVKLGPGDSAQLGVNVKVPTEDEQAREHIAAIETFLESLGQPPDVEEDIVTQEG